MRPRLSKTWAATCGLLGSLASAMASPIAPESRIDHVTIYADRADVERVAERVGLQTGMNRIRFPGLPPDLDPGSVRAAGRGSAGVRIVNVDVRRENLEAPADTPGIERLNRDREEVEQRMREVRARKEALEAGHAFLESVRVRESLEAGEALAGPGPDPERLARTLAFLTEEVAANRFEDAELGVELSELQARRESIARDLAARRAAPGRTPWTVEVELEAERAGTVSLELAYSTPGARWAPTYDVIVSEDIADIEIVYAADVQQRTGEDWTDVAITLSSAQPALGAQMPALEPWWLAFPHPSKLAEQAGTVQLGDQIFVRGGRKDELKTYVTLPPEVESPIQPVEARASGLFATSFEVPVRQDLPSDGRSRRMRIGAVEVEGQVEHRCVPRLSPHVFLVASATNASELPLLGGSSRVILGGQFLGQGRIPDVAPGQEFDLSLGVDRAVSVQRQRVKREIEVSGDRGKAEVGYRIDVANYRREPIRLMLSDQVPLSPDEDVRVRTRDLTPAPDAEPDEDGFLTWTLEVAPDGEERIELAYEVKFPSGKPPVNLDR